MNILLYEHVKIEKQIKATATKQMY